MSGYAINESADVSVYDVVQTWVRRRRPRRVERLQCLADGFHKDVFRRPAVSTRSLRAVCPRYWELYVPTARHSELYVPWYHVLERLRIVTIPRRLSPIPAVTWQRPDFRRKWRHDRANDDDNDVTDDIDTRPTHYCARAVLHRHVTA